MQIPGSIRRWRNEASLKQSYMAAKLHMTQQAYSDIETDKTNLAYDKAVEIAALLKIDVSLIWIPDKHNGQINLTPDKEKDLLRELLKEKDAVNKGKDEVIKEKERLIKFLEKLLGLQDGQEGNT
jgi:transcriptional regulator with XRE-family HTH domain